MSVKVERFSSPGKGNGLRAVSGVPAGGRVWSAAPLAACVSNTLTGEVCSGCFTRPSPGPPLGPLNRPSPHISAITTGPGRSASAEPLGPAAGQSTFGFGDGPVPNVRRHAAALGVGHTSTWQQKMKVDVEV
ncbi:unnamed protein product [Boreogadus saida]